MLFLRTLRVVLLMKSKHTHPLSTDTHSNTHATLWVALTSLNLCTHSHEDGVDYYAPLRSITPWWSLRGCFELCGFLREKTASLSVCNIQHPLLRHLLIKAHRYRNGYCNILFFVAPPPFNDTPKILCTLHYQSVQRLCSHWRFSAVSDALQ